MGLAHRGFRLFEPRHHIVRILSDAGYHTEMVGEQHVSASPETLGYDVVHDISDTTVNSVAPAAIEALSGGIEQPFFMSVGFFETHRSFFPPSSVRDRVYSLPPPFLPDTPEIRQDIAAYKASARSLDQGVGAVLNTLNETGLDRNTLVICTTDHGLAFPTAKASLLDRGTGVMLIMRGPGMPPGGAHDELVSQLDIYPTICEVAGIDPPPWLEGRSLIGLVSGTEAGGRGRSVRSEVFTELTYHAAYEPQRAIRTERFKYVRRFDDYPFPVLPNCDDSPSKDAYLERGWATRPVARERLHDLFFNPGEGRNSIDDPAYADVLADLRSRLERWMVETDDPLLQGPVAPPPGARINRQDQRSAEDPTMVAESIS
jgi:N-sulfoglucosamine sulfohydrolase